MKQGVVWPSNGLGEVPFRLYTDPEQYRLEQERIFKGLYRAKVEGFATDSRTTGSDSSPARKVSWQMTSARTKVKR
jgi:hypothetical protein